MTLPISHLQLGLIVAGVLLVLGVIGYNAWQERRVRRRIASAFRPTAATPKRPPPCGRCVRRLLRYRRHRVRQTCLNLRSFRRWR